METVIEILKKEFESGFLKCGYDKKYAIVSVSNRPDLCEYQCNGAMAAAKAYKKAPIAIANEVVDAISESSTFEKIEAIAPGFINLKVSNDFINRFISQMNSDNLLGFKQNVIPNKVVIDYGGPNVAKPLHVGHLRSAIIGESIKRILRFAGDDVTSDIHLGDWGLQIGQIIEELRDRNPKLVYFDKEYSGEYPIEPPFTISELEQIYPAGSKKCKTDEQFAKRAHDTTAALQMGNKGYRAIWKHIMKVSVADLKKNYDNLNVDFDIWKGESDAQPYIDDMVNDMIIRGFAHESQGATVVDVSREDDKKELPPCIIRKQDGAALYATSDLATLIEREKIYDPNSFIYVVDKRQELHFTQVFRVAKMTGIVKEDAKMTFIGFGTMNGKDGKPFKTREGGVMRLEVLIKDVKDAVYKKMMENRQVDEEEANNTSKLIGMAAIKYGDLSNQASKDYIFDMDRFTSFEGNTGPYILYTIVRIKSILEKYNSLPTHSQKAEDIIKNKTIECSGFDSEKSLKLVIAKFNEAMRGAYEDLAPHKICAYVYELSNAFNRFYHDNNIMANEDKEVQANLINLIALTKNVLLQCIDLLGINAPDRM